MGGDTTSVLETHFKLPHCSITFNLSSAAKCVAELSLSVNKCKVLLTKEKL